MTRPILLAARALLLAVTLGAGLGRAQADPAGAVDSTRFVDVVPVAVAPALSSLPDDQGHAAATRTGLDVIRIEVDRGVAPADGQSAVNVTVRLLDRAGQPLKSPMSIAVESSAGRISLPERDALAADAAHPNLDRVVGGISIRVIDGVAHFRLLAPEVPHDVVLRVTAGGAEASGMISFVPEMREMLATGLVEGIVSLNHTSDANTPASQLENELVHFQDSFDNGRGSLGARSEFFLKGVVQGQYLLTMAYDSEKAGQSPLFRDIRPEEFYPVYGDASVKGFDAQTTQKLYVRIDHDHSFLMYGDFTTGTTLHNPASLGNYQRSLTGIDSHEESSAMVTDAYAAHSSSQRVVDEQPSRGTSGPYYVSNLNGIRNSEKVEILTRDRNQPSVILNDQVMTRYVDYTFDPFAGQVFFMQPVPTVDANFNPITIRISYEVDSGGPGYWVFGGSVQVKVGDRASVGGSYAEDRSPSDRYRLESVNGTIKLDDTTSLSGEVAHSSINRALDPTLTQNEPAIASGTGFLVDLRHADGPWQYSVVGGRTDIGFINPTATLETGRTEVAARTSYQVDPELKVAAELLDSADRTSGADRASGQVYAAYQINPIFSFEAGLRRSEDHVGSLNGQPVAVDAAAAGITNTPIGQSFNAYQTNSPQLQQAPALVDSTSLRLRMTAQLGEKSQVYGEVERDVSDAAKHRFGLGANYQIGERTRLYAREEWSSSSSGPDGLMVGGGRDAMTTVGIEENYMKDGQVFSEYRLRDAQDERDSEAAFGLRNMWQLADGIRANTSFERQTVLFSSTDSAVASGAALPVSGITTPTGNAQSAAASGNALGNTTGLPSVTPLTVPYTTGAATVLTGALEFTYAPDWRAAARLELRQDPAYNAVLSTLAFNEKIDLDWTFLARNYLNDLEGRSSTYPDQYEDRAQVGAAFRPVNNNQWNGLVRYELRLTENLTEPDPAREMANIFSGQINYHPSRQWWLSGRLAAEKVNDDLSGVHSDYFAYLVGARVLYDITPRWDAGVTVDELISPYGHTREHATGVEVGYLLKANLWISAGYNWTGFSNRDLTGTDYTNRGVYVRLRFKFDEDLMNADLPADTDPQSTH